jgi:hypothetical protein
MNVDVVGFASKSNKIRNIKCYIIFKLRHMKQFNRHIRCTFLMLLYQSSRPFFNLLIVFAKLGPLMINDAELLRIC